MIETIISNLPVYLIVAVRCFAFIRTTPLLSNNAVSRIAKIALAGYVAFLVFPYTYTQGWNVDPYSLEYVLILIAEALIGVLTGFFISVVYATFIAAGQFFTFQMGLGAAEAYDALAQVENPLMGQMFNLIAMLLFLKTRCFQKLFLVGVLKSFQSINAFVIISNQDMLIGFLLKSLGKLFYNGLLIAMPIIGTLFLVSVAMGLLSKAAPQMNLLSEGLPLTILISFFLLYMFLPFMCNFFDAVFDTAFHDFSSLLFNMVKGES